MRRPFLGMLVTVCLAAGVTAQDRAVGARDLSATLARLGEHVQHYYARAQSIMCLETVRLQPLGASMSPDGFARQLVYELRVSWEPSEDGGPLPEATVLRQLVSINGRPPRPKDEPGCMDPKAVSPEPLGMLLPGSREKYAFKWAGAGRTDGRSTVMVDYRSVVREPASVVWKGECVSVSLPGRTRGRVWVDTRSEDILRFDEELTEMYEVVVPKEHARFGWQNSMIIERADTSIRYKPVTFRDPDETLILPSSIQTLQVIRNSGVPRLRMTQTFSGYKRFLTAGRIVSDPDR